MARRVQAARTLLREAQGRLGATPLHGPRHNLAVPREHTIRRWCGFLEPTVQQVLRPLTGTLRQFAAIGEDRGAPPSLRDPPGAVFPDGTGSCQEESKTPPVSRRGLF